MKRIQKLNDEWTVHDIAGLLCAACGTLELPAVLLYVFPWFLIGWIIYISLFALIIVLLLRMIRNENEKMKMERKTEEKKRDIKFIDFF